ncbi:MAG: arginase family protein, partial [Rhodospirillales bacterium]|nr:arginase family protein [Rhodospirillales bacterium]
MSTDQNQMSLPRYMGVPTFMRTPYQPDPAGLDIALIGVPYDGAVTNRAGARHGPREMRNQSSMMRSIHHVSKINPYDLCRIADIGDVTFDGVFDHDAVVRDIEAFYARVHAAGVVPLSAGGDHSVTYPIFKAIAKEAPLGLIHIDAHTDTWDQFQGSKFMHGTPFRRAHEDGLLDGERTVQIGIRGAQNSPEGWDYSLE